MNTCKICGGTDYHSQKNGKYLRRVCKFCERQRSKRYREAHKEEHRNRRPEIERARKQKQRAIDLFKNKCVDCQQTFPMSVYDFHHLDPTSKERGYRNRGLNFTKAWNKIQAELQKCVMLCANCHRIRHIK